MSKNLTGINSITFIGEGDVLQAVGKQITIGQEHEDKVKGFKDFMKGLPEKMKTMERYVIPSPVRDVDKKMIQKVTGEPIDDGKATDAPNPAENKPKKTRKKDVGRAEMVHKHSSAIRRRGWSKVQHNLGLRDDETVQGLVP